MNLQILQPPHLWECKRPVLGWYTEASKPAVVKTTTPAPAAVALGARGFPDRQAARMDITEWNGGADSPL